MSRVPVATGRRAARRPAVSACAGVSMKWSETFSPASTIRVPEPAGVDLRLARDGFDGRHARRRVDAAHAPFGGLARAGECQQAQGEKETLHRSIPTMSARRSRSALPTTLTDDSAIAAAAMIGDSSRPKTG